MKEFDTDRVDSTERREPMTEKFHALYDAEPQIAVRAPGRVDLMGSHTDYNEGFVMTLPNNRETSYSLKFQSLSRRNPLLGTVEVGELFWQGFLTVGWR